MKTKMKIKQSDIFEFQRDLRRMKIRHYPFVRDAGYYHVELYETNKISFLQMKYSAP